MDKSSLSIIVPCYNEESSLYNCIKRIYEIDFGCDFEVIIVNDGSTDGTTQVIKKIASEFPSIRAFEMEKNSGKGAALREGFKNAKNDLIIIQDADLEYHPADILKLKNELESKNLDVVYGSRLLNKENDFLLLSKLANKFLSFLTTIISDVKVSDMETCYKMFKRDLLKDIKTYQNSFDFEPEFTMKMLSIVKSGNLKFAEVPIYYFPRTKSEGKKISAKDGIIAVYCIIKYGLAKSN